MKTEKKDLKMNEGKTSFLTCDWLEHGLMFDHCNTLRSCCILNIENGGKPVIINDYHGEVEKNDKIFEIKRKIREEIKRGTVPSECKGCHWLHPRENDEEEYIDNIIFSHWIDCNSDCIYCLATKDDKVRSLTSHYDIVPAIRDLICRNLIKRDGRMDFAGGEPTVYPEFEKLLNLFADSGFTNITVNTSCIKYDKAIERVLREGKAQVTVSVDAGTSAMHRKIKGVNSFDTVWKNLTEYSRAQSLSGLNDKLCVKYLVLPGVNDDLTEMSLFLKNVNEAEIKTVALNVEMMWYKEHKNDDLSDLTNKLKRFVEEAEGYGFTVQLYPWAEWPLSQREG